MFKTVIVGVDGSSADADALALARLLVQPGGAVVPTTSSRAVRSDRACTMPPWRPTPT